MKLKITLLFLFCTTSSFTQEQKFLNNDTRLYTEASTSSKFIGFFRTNAQVEVISKYDDNWHFVKADNHNTGYVLTKYLSNKYTSNSTQPQDLENPILRGDQYYGNYHLFVNVASLRARGAPSKTGKIITTLTTGEAVPVKYVPLDIEDWVFISSGRFIQRKYLSKRPKYEELMKLFDNFEIDNITDRGKIAERIIQLAWNSDHSQLYKAYKTYYQVAIQLGNNELIEDVKMNLVLAKGLASTKPFEEIQTFINEAHFKIKNLNVNDTYINYEDLISNYGEPTHMEGISDECGVYFGDTFYKYPKMLLSVNKKDNKAELVTVQIDINNSFYLNKNVVLDYTVTEKEFVSKYAQYIYTNFNYRNQYTFLTDDGGYNIMFKNGKIYSVNVYYLC